MALASVVAVRVAPLLLVGVPEDERAAYRFTAADGRAYPYLGDYDSYLWLRNARNVLATGTSCDVVRDGHCLDRLAPAPMGGEMRYARSLHIAAIVALHRVLAAVRPGIPLEASAALVPIVVGTLGVLPAFALGRRLGGPLAGLVAAVASALNPMVLARSIGGDNDAWNVVLPLALAWAATCAAASRTAGGVLGWGALAGVVTALHAATWRGWVLAYAIVAAGLGMEAARRGVRALASPLARRPAAWRVAGIALGALAVWWCVAGVGVRLLAPDEPYFGLPLRLLAGEASTAASGPAWPDVFATVAELQRPDLPTIAGFVGGPALFFVSWLGVLVLLLPRARWQTWHVLALIAGTLVYRWLLTAPDVGRRVLVLLLALPPAATLVAETWRRRGRDPADRTAELVTVVWFLATLLLAFDGLRYVMLLAPPCALAAGAAIGRLHGWLARVLRVERRGPLAVAALLAGCAALSGPWLWTGWRAARDYRPAMQDAWWDALSRIRAETPPDTIVFAWWDYGYWIKSVAERRVAADGGLLRTHVPYWLARAFLAPSEAETVGLLRMLACGSDATPEPAGAQGGYGRLVAAGVDPRAAPALLGEIASLDRAAAAGRLAAHGLDPAAREAVLQVTHCDPPPALLVVPDGPAPLAWSELAGWDFEHGRGPAALPDSLSRHACRREGDEVRCPIDDRAEAPEGRRLELVWSVGRPQAARFLVRDDDGAAAAQAFSPAWLAILGPDGPVPAPRPTGDALALGALLYPTLPAVLVGPPELLAATHTRLTELGGLGLARLSPFDDRPLLGGGRLRTWRIAWPSPPDGR